MLRRAPYEFGGSYYRVLPEGWIDDYDGISFDIPRPMDGNLNRNFPANWGTEVEQYGAGEYPMSEPEVKALVDFFKAHPNIHGVADYHTNAGVILPPFRPADDPMSVRDEGLFRRIGQKVCDGFLSLGLGDFLIEHVEIERILCAKRYSHRGQQDDHSGAEHGYQGGIHRGFFFCCDSFSSPLKV